MLKTCSEISLDSKEQLFGTTPKVNYWILIEYNSEWEENVLKSINISQAVKSKISELLQSREYTRLQWIKRVNNNDDLITLYFAESTELNKNLYKRQIAAYEDILRLNFKNIHTDNYRSETPLLLICTHNSYDSCCGKQGFSLYKDVCDDNYFDVWQTSHLGGHRFAPNVLLLPEGLYYGRVDSSKYETIKNDFINNQLSIEILRGRSFHDKYIQAADHYLRISIGNSDFDSLNYISSGKLNEQAICVNFKYAASNSSYKVIIEELPAIMEICPGCNDRKMKTISQFRLLNIEKTMV